jgi:hypothetical protein
VSENGVAVAGAFRDVELLLRWPGAAAYVQHIPSVSRLECHRGPGSLGAPVFVSCLRKLADG